MGLTPLKFKGNFRPLSPLNIDLYQATMEKDERQYQEICTLYVKGPIIKQK